MTITIIMKIMKMKKNRKKKMFNIITIILKEDGGTLMKERTMKLCFSTNKAMSLKILRIQMLKIYLSFSNKKIDLS